MGCGRSRHRSPSLQPDGLHKEKTDARDRDGKRGAKKQKQAEKHAAKAVSKREAESARSSPKKTSNGKTDIRSDLSGGGATDRKENVGKRNWQLEEAVDTPPETVLAVYRSSTPASARTSLKATPLQDCSNNFNSNGSLLNGGSQKTSTVAHEIEMQMEVPDKTATRDKTSTGCAKPVHITSSQLEFFKMLDERIEKGADYNSDDE